MTGPLAWPSDAEGWPHPDRSRFVSAAGLSWHVQDWGAQGPAILLIHGSGGSNHSWGHLAPRLHARGFRIVAPDLPGHGFTDRPTDPGLTLDGITAGLRELLTELGARPSWIVGHSAGAAVALELARALPCVRGVVGVCPSLLPGRDLPVDVLPGFLARGVRSGLVARTAAAIARGGRTVERLLKSTGSNVPPESVRLYRRLTGAPGHVNATLTLFSQWNPREVAGRLEANQVPCLLLAGTEDTWIPSDDVIEAARRLPRGVGRMVPGGHLTHEEHPGRIAQEILTFVADAQGAAGDEALA